MLPVLWIFLPVVVAGGSALLVFYFMQARVEVAVARERETLAETRATLVAQQKVMVEQIKATEEERKRKALDAFLADGRIEERHYIRENNSLFMNRKCLVLQERLFFRNIPLSNWVEHEMIVEQGSDLPQLAKAGSVFGLTALSSTPAPARTKLLR